MVLGFIVVDTSVDYNEHIILLLCCGTLCYMVPYYRCYVFILLIHCSYIITMFYVVLLCNDIFCHVL